MRFHLVGMQTAGRACMCVRALRPRTPRSTAAPLRNLPPPLAPAAPARSHIFESHHAVFLCRVLVPEIHSTSSWVSFFFSITAARVGPLQGSRRLPRPVLTRTGGKRTLQRPKGMQRATQLLLCVLAALPTAVLLYSLPLRSAPGWRGLGFGQLGAGAGAARPRVAAAAATCAAATCAATRAGGAAGGDAASQVFQSSPLAQLLEWLQAPFSAAQQEKDGRTGTIVRLGAKGKPDPVREPLEVKARSPAKRPVTTAMLTPAGMDGDYNQYRTEVLRGTKARAVSILTSDVMQALRTEGWAELGEGELGENVLVAGVPYDFFALGRSYMLGGSLVRPHAPRVTRTQRERERERERKKERKRERERERERERGTGDTCCVLCCNTLQNDRGL